MIGIAKDRRKKASVSTHKRMSLEAQYIFTIRSALSKISKDTHSGVGKMVKKYSQPILRYTELPMTSLCVLTEAFFLLSFAMPIIACYSFSNVIFTYTFRSE